ncbi:Glycosyl transferase family 2 [Ruminococcaceae bacterium YRB3002]|nr:Glycosyl transferase family 2 [Ruminococcaceae bacterium YRB3002]
MLSLIVPAYNEAEHIYDNLRIIADTLTGAGISYEILAVNDGSRDHTGTEIARAAASIPGVRDCGYDVNRGKGGAILHGIKNSKGDMVGFLDADLELPASLVPGFVSCMESTGCDVVIGSKMHKDSKLEYPFMRKVMSLGYYAILKVLFGLKCKDTQTGIKIYRGDLLRRIGGVQMVDSYAFDIEQLALANSVGAVIVEMPVEVVYTREGSMSRIKIGAIFGMFCDTIRIWWKLRVKKAYKM